MSNAPQTPNRATSAANQKPKMPGNGSKAPTAAKTAEPAKAEGEKKKEKRLKVRLVSETIPGLWVRAYVDVVNKFGFPLDPNGTKMVPGKATSFGLTAEERERRKAEKEAEKKRLEAMTEEQKLAYVAQKREAKQKKRDEKKAMEKAKLVAEIKAELAAQGMLKDSGATAPNP